MERPSEKFSDGLNGRGAKNAPRVHTAANPIHSMDAAAKVALLQRIETLAKAADPRIVQVMAGLTCEYDLIYIARLDGRHAADIRPLVRLSLTVIAKQGERREQGSAGGGGRFDLAYFDDAKIQEYVNHAVKQAVTNLESRPAFSAIPLSAEAAVMAYNRARFQPLQKP